MRASMLSSSVSSLRARSRQSLASGTCISHSNRQLAVFSSARFHLLSKGQETPLFDRRKTLNTRLFSAVPAELDIKSAPSDTVEVPPKSESIKGLKSKPVEGGNWDQVNPVRWSENFGSRSEEYKQRLKPLISLKSGDEGYFDVTNTVVPNVSIVQTKEQAKIVMERLMNADPSIFHACDTEVMDIDLKSVGPIGNGYVTCASVYSGPDFDYGLGDGPGTALWIDNLDASCGILQEFKEWFEDDRFLKVWHNYGFDRHEMWNEGIDCLGFGGDTMHMARLQDTSRAKMAQGGGYGLEALTADILGKRKRPMKEIFGVARLRKDGSEGSLVDIPPVEVMQRDLQFREKWIMYSAYDAEGTWLLREKLQKMLEAMPWQGKEHMFDYYHAYMREFGQVLTDMERRGIRVDVEYLAGVEVQARKDRKHHLAEFRKWASKFIGADGLALNPASSVQLCTFLFGGAQNIKTKEALESVRVFKVPREEINEEALGAYEEREREKQGMMSINEDSAEPQKDDLDHMTGVQLKALCKARGLKVAGTKAELQDRLRQHFCAPEDDLDTMSDQDLRDACAARGLKDNGKRPALMERIRMDIWYANELIAAQSPQDSDGYKSISEALEAAANKDGGDLKEILSEIKEKSQAKPKYIDVTITSIGLKPEKYTVGGAPSVTADVLRALAGDPFGDDPKYGTAYDYFGGGEAGHDACAAIFSLCAIGSIDTMIANFLTSLQKLADGESRVHCSLNLNTETGRLSSRRPNLQNQPALEKDKYKIRQSFLASPGNNLIVADYGQLELRLLASMTNCKSMIEAFDAGGDFHSRTALGMFDYIQEKVDNGDCLLEWDYSKGDPPKPMLKDLYASERRKAKTLNFSIAYGKTAHGLSKDWGVSTKEADEMLEAWYNSRPEVREWQQKTKEIAKKHGITRTLMGRYRQLPGAMSDQRGLVGHAERASINTPIQGGAADVAMMAMIKINNSETLKNLGWVLLMQIHDEVILEGPTETAEEAFDEVIHCMMEPWVHGLRKTSVPLLVDGSWHHNNWYDAK
eukprot:CAMPEP_0198296976 /NCGR_PEP_ID=MMETSP1449-20131203/34802_1 /TAXON_ID=420275 /ORGANISM="Attheya septentrionalis, Strain CCMP2084" /LENGTH=1036 /DNA_ID=CAMNT_0043997751 /DNA_START=341 /DNA_END=3451 /DNA_ORIENTATION=+